MGGGLHQSGTNRTRLRDRQEPSNNLGRQPVGVRIVIKFIFTSDNPHAKWQGCYPCTLTRASSRVTEPQLAGHRAQTRGSQSPNSRVTKPQLAGHKAKVKPALARVFSSEFPR
jgi:hypothetical protein